MIWPWQRWSILKLWFIKCFNSAQRWSCVISTRCVTILIISNHLQNSYECARLSVGATINMVTAVVEDRVTNGMAVIRWGSYGLFGGKIIGLLMWEEHIELYYGSDLFIIVHLEGGITLLTNNAQLCIVLLGSILYVKPLFSIIFTCDPEPG